MSIKFRQIRPKLVARILISMGLLVFLEAAVAGETLNNESIVQMVQARLSTDVILEAIRANPGEYSLGVSDLIKLKHQGVPDQVILAMQAKGHGDPAPKTKAESPVPKLPQEGACDNPGVWTVKNDRMGTLATACERTKEDVEPGLIKLTVKCSIFDDDYLAIVYTSDAKPRINLLHYPPLRNSESNFLVPFNFFPNGQRGAYNLSSSEDFSNAIHVSFPLLRAGGTGFNLLYLKSFSFTFRSENNEEHALDLNLHNASFKNFISACARYPKYGEYKNW